MGAMTQLPMCYADIIGQEDSVARLAAFSEFYRKNNSTPEHVLIVAEDGMGKRTIANALANELGLSWQEVNASELRIKGDFSSILTNLGQSELVIINEVDRLKPSLQQMLVDVTKKQKLTISIGEGPAARIHSMDIVPFTVVGTTQKKSECSDELLSCFSLILSLQSYSPEALEKIAQRIAALGNLEVDLARR
jgi:Holliday junction DNA helicase RuvB